MAEIQLLRRDHSAELLAFERENRAYFAASIPDRGDDYFTEFDMRTEELLAEQASGTCYFHVVVGETGQVLGRVNLVDVDDGCAELGYRIAESAAGRGLATWAVTRVGELARNTYGLTRLRAETTLDNAASLTLLARAGFAPDGEIELDGRPGRRFVLDLATARG